MHLLYYHPNQDIKRFHSIKDSFLFISSLFSSSKVTASAYCFTKFVFPQYKTSYTILCLNSFIWHNIWKIHSCCCINFFLFLLLCGFLFYVNNKTYLSILLWWIFSCFQLLALMNKPFRMFLFSSLGE